MYSPHPTGTDWPVPATAAKHGSYYAEGLTGLSLPTKGEYGSYDAEGLTGLSLPSIGEYGTYEPRRQRTDCSVRAPRSEYEHTSHAGSGLTVLSVLSRANTNIRATQAANVGRSYGATPSTVTGIRQLKLLRHIRPVRGSGARLKSSTSCRQLHRLRTLPSRPLHYRSLEED